MSVMQSPETTFYHRDCPTCGSAQRDLVIQTPGKAEDQEFESLRPQWYGFFKAKMLFSYFRCASCGMLYAPTYFTSEQLADLYGSMPANMAEVNDEALGRTQRGYFEEFKKRAALRGVFLEIGPDVGYFAEQGAIGGSYEKFWLFEPNVEIHGELQRRLNGKNFEISTELLDLSIVEEGTVDAAAMIHVLDHLIDPKAFMKQIRTKLRKGAVIFVVTHDEGSLLAQVTKAKWPAYCLQHPHLFRPKTMKTLLESCGFGDVQITRSTNYFPVMFLLKHALYVAGIKANVPAMPAIQLPLRLGNFITTAVAT
jgi:hypothetical protein